MDKHLGGRLDIVSHRGEIISLGVPAKSTDDHVCKFDTHLDVRVSAVSLEHPLERLLFGFVSRNIQLVGFFCFSKHFPSRLIHVPTVHLGTDKMNLVAICDSKQTGVHTWTPLNTVDNLVWKFVFAQDFRSSRVPNHQIMIFVS